MYSWVNYVIVACFVVLGLRPRFVFIVWNHIGCSCRDGLGRGHLAPTETYRVCRHSGGCRNPGRAGWIKRSISRYFLSGGLETRPTATCGHGTPCPYRTSSVFVEVKNTSMSGDTTIYKRPLIICIVMQPLSRSIDFTTSSIAGMRKEPVSDETS